MAGKQGRLQGMQPREVVEIEEKAEEVKDLENKRKDVAAQEKKAREELTELMKEHKRGKYDIGENENMGDGEWYVELKRGEAKAYVRRKKAKQEDVDPKAEGDEKGEGKDEAVEDEAVA